VTIAPIINNKTQQYENELKEVDLVSIRTAYQREVAINYIMANYPYESVVDTYNYYYM
jgi:hypothetical protein